MRNSFPSGCDLLVKYKEYLAEVAGLKCVWNMKQYFIEMCGKNAIIVMDVTGFEIAEESVICEAFGRIGQQFTAFSRVIVHKKFTSRLMKHPKILRMRDGFKIPLMLDL
jgi:acyl-CoA reductase-like NAD-dependent aldehyde dehydrogenase